MKYCYCLFCETIKCNKIANKLVKEGIGTALSPQIIKRQRKNGRNIDLAYDLLPGYVFVFSEEPVEAISMLRIDGVIRILGLKDDGYCLQENDREFALRLLERKGRIDVIKLINVGDKVKVEDKFFAGCEGKVLQIDYRKQRAKILFAFSGMQFTSWCACDIVYPEVKKELQLETSTREE